MLAASLSQQMGSIQVTYKATSHYQDTSLSPLTSTRQVLAFEIFHKSVSCSLIRMTDFEFPFFRSAIQ